MKILILTEKPSQARDFAKALGNCKQKEGYYDCGKYIITWAVGHLFEIDDSVAPTKWSLETLPIYPEKFKLKLRRGGGKQFKIIKGLLRGSDSVILASVGYDEPILIFDGEKPIFTSVGEFVDRFFDTGNGSFREEKILPKRFYCLAFDKEGKVKLRPIKGVVRHKADLHRLYRIKTSYGREIIASEHHSFFVLKDGKPRPVETKKLSVGDEILVPANINLPEREIVLDLLKEFANNGTNSKKTKLPRFLKLDEDFAFFLGVFVADGSVNKNRGYIRLYFGKSKPFYKEVKTRVISFLQKKNIKFKLFQISEKLEELRVYSQLLALVLTDVLKVGFRGVKNRRSEEKDIPNILFIAPKRVKKAFVEAYIKSDGSPNGNNFVVSTVSERIYKKLPYLSHSCDFPVVFTTKRKTPKGVIYIGHTVSYKKVKKYWGNLVSVKIIEIEEIKDYPYPWIYDLSVDTDTEGNFICGRGGVCQHNTDPGREGELIAREILQMAGWKNWDKTYRFWTSEALTPEVIRKHLKNLKPAREFDSLYYSALARQHADWVVGINFTRLATLKSNSGDVWSVGRVQTPTLRLIVEREEEIQNFQPEEYFVIKATFQKENKNYEGILIRDKSFIEKLLKEDIKDLEPLEED